MVHVESGSLIGWPDKSDGYPISLRGDPFPPKATGFASGIFQLLEDARTSADSTGGK
jgi:hypothetical protein